VGDKKYHVFWCEPYGNTRRYEAFGEIEPVLRLVKADYDHRQGKYSNVAGLRVVYGELLEFEPCEVVTTFMVKETQSK
jgi:hypothetical protein